MATPARWFCRNCVLQRGFVWGMDFRLPSLLKATHLFDNQPIRHLSLCKISGQKFRPPLPGTPDFPEPRSGLSHAVTSAANSVRLKNLRKLC